MAEGAVGDQGDAVALAPGQHGVLDRALLQVVEHLVASDAARPGDGERFLQVGDVEVAHAPAQDLARALGSSKAAKVSSSAWSPGQCSR